MKQNTTTIGHEAETYACKYLQANGLKLLQRNFRCRMGEIDLIMQDKDELVFIEVRLRNHPGYGDGVDSITWQKQQKIARTAEFYLNQHHSKLQPHCRFDVMALTRQDGEFHVEWLQFAFGD